MLLDVQIWNVFSLIHSLIKLPLLGAPVEHLVLEGVCRGSYCRFALQSKNCSRISGKQFGNVWTLRPLCSVTACEGGGSAQEMRSLQFPEFFTCSELKSPQIGNRCQQSLCPLVSSTCDQHRKCSSRAQRRAENLVSAPRVTINSRRRLCSKMCTLKPSVSMPEAAHFWVFVPTLPILPSKRNSTTEE